MPELCGHCGELIDVDHQPHIVVYSDDEPNLIAGFLHIKCSDEFEKAKTCKRREALRFET
jgi:hypothetical protein